MILVILTELSLRNLKHQSITQIMNLSNSHQHARGFTPDPETQLLSPVIISHIQSLSLSLSDEIINV